MDHWIGTVLDKLKQFQIYDKTLIIITADHGEEFQEHGSMTHGNLFQECIHVPLIIKLPSDSVDYKLIDAPVEAGVDLLPTIIDIIGIQKKFPFEGKSLTPYLNLRVDRKFREDGRFRFSESLSNADENLYRVSVLRNGNKFIYTTHFPTVDFSNFRKNDDFEELYNLDSDKEELNNLAGVTSPELKVLKEACFTFIDNAVNNKKRLHNYEKDEFQLTPEQLQRLKALGYVK